jgi:hypothetical protein
LQRHGVSIQAHLESKEASTGKGTSYRVRYCFESPDGRTWQGTSSVGGPYRADWDAAGPTVAVRYLAEDPAVNCWVVELHGASGSLAAALGLGLLGLLLVVAGIAATRLTPEQFERWWIEGRPT